MSFFNTVDLVNQLEAEARGGKAGWGGALARSVAHRLVPGRLATCVRAGGQMMFTDQPALRAHLGIADPCVRGWRGVRRPKMTTAPH